MRHRPRQQTPAFDPRASQPDYLDVESAPNYGRSQEAYKLTHVGGSLRDAPDLLGLYAPPSGDANTPDTVDGFWWLAQPKAQQMWELGLRREDEYERVHRDVSAMATAVLNRATQAGVHVPFTIRRKRTAQNRSLFAGGNLRRIGPVRS